MFAKLIAIYQAVTAGEYIRAAILFAQLLEEILKDVEQPTPMGSAGDVDACIAECEKIMAMDAAPMAADEAENPGILFAIALIQALAPIVLEWLKKRRAG